VEGKNIPSREGEYFVSVGTAPFFFEEKDVPSSDSQISEDFFRYPSSRDVISSIGISQVDLISKVASGEIKIDGGTYIVPSSFVRD
jgi:hypothetical protein